MRLSGDLIMILSTYDILFFAPIYIFYLPLSPATGLTIGFLLRFLKKSCKQEQDRPTPDSTQHLTENDRSWFWLWYFFYFDTPLPLCICYFYFSDSTTIRPIHFRLMFPTDTRKPTRSQETSDSIRFRQIWPSDVDVDVCCRLTYGRLDPTKRRSI